MTTAGHGEAVYLGLHVNNLLSVGLQPSDIDLNIKVTDAVTKVRLTLEHTVKMTYFETMASSGMASKCLAVMMSLLPVVVTKTLARWAASSMVQTS